MDSEVLATTLPNGLTILTREVHDAPVATFWLWYRVGARNEVTGLTGISHWVEHMLFKGTPTFEKGEIFRSVTKNGGTLNGFTSIDFTTYFETLPSDRLDIALRIESDRMANAVFDPNEVENERTVILSEREGSENYPLFHLTEEVNAMAFKAHPYGQGVIGWKSDLLGLTRDDLYTHYRQYYVPSNAVAVAVGDFATSQLLTRIEDLFGNITSGFQPRDVRSVEPLQEGERRVTLRRPGPTPYFALSYHVPSASDSEIFPLIVLDAILSGAKPMGLSGSEGTMGRSARLYVALVDSGLASGASSSVGLTRDPYLFDVLATVRSDVDIARVEQVTLDVVERLRQEWVADSEIDKARKQVKAQLAYASEGVTSQAYWLGYLEMVHSYKIYDQLLSRIEAVTKEDIQRVAQRYFGEKNRTAGWLIPQPGNGEPELPQSAISSACPRFLLGNRNTIWSGGIPQFLSESPDLLPSRTRFPGVGEQSTRTWPICRPDGGRNRSSLVVRREVLQNGVVVIGHESFASPSVVIRANCRAGSVYDPPGKAGLAVFTARMLQRGTHQHTFQEINDLTDRVGATLSTDAAAHTAQIAVRCLSEDFHLMVELMASVLRCPTFPEGEVSKLRGQLLTRLREQEDDTRSVAARRFQELIYPEGHPYHHWSLGYQSTIDRMNPEDLAGFHRRQARPDALAITVVGGIRFDLAVSALRKVLDDWQVDGSPVDTTVPPVPRPTSLIREDIALDGKTQSDLVVGLPAISRGDSDYYALSFANLILGGLGLMGRLGDVVRDRLGLAYYVYSSLESLPGPGSWRVHAGVNPISVDRAFETILDEIERIRQEPVSDEEINDGKSYLTGALPLALETNSGIARILEQIELHQLGLDYVDRFPGIIQALTKDQIRDAAHRYLSRENLVAVVAGPKRGI